MCDETGEVLAIKYNDFKQLYLQIPQFGFYFLQLTARRLFENIGNLENAIAARDVRLPERGEPATA
ncbi:MAG: hypothetical protein ACR2K5_00225 [Pseudolabrys sp.]